VCEPELDGHTVAKWLYDAVLLVGGPAIWINLWPVVQPQLDVFLAALEGHIHAPGLAREARSVLERLMENNWSLRAAGGNEAQLMFLFDGRDSVRIAIEKFVKGATYDIQLNQPRLRVKANQRYVVSFRARSETPRRIFLGFAKAHEPWTNLGLYAEIDLKKEWQDFEKHFIVTEDEDNARIHFDVGNSGISFELSSVSLQSLVDGRVIRPDVHRVQSSEEIAAGKQSGVPIGRDILERDEIKGVPHRTGGLDWGWQATRKGFDRTVLVLMYHRVSDLRLDPWSLSVTPKHFEEHLEILGKYGRPLSHQELLEAFRNGKLARRSVVLTFDDGYADNLYNARPLLERYDITATVFVTTGQIGKKREFWWDELERLLLQPGTLPEVLQLKINGKNHLWRLGEASYYSEEACSQHRHWRAGEKPPNFRHGLYHALWQLLQPLPEGDQQRVLDELLAWGGAEQEIRATHRTLSGEEVLALGRDNLVEIGSHTVTHPLLPALPISLQRDEVRQSKVTLEEILGRPVRSFAYPYGAYTAETVSVVREAGFDCAFSTVDGVVGQGTDRYQLPRVEVQDWDGEEFRRKLSEWFA
jgi:peptidoglycan/xylan/chitin deacetylase (PgdA/CDA1 family)